MSRNSYPLFEKKNWKWGDGRSSSGMGGHEMIIPKAARKSATPPQPVFGTFPNYNKILPKTLLMLF